MEGLFEKVSLSTVDEKLSNWRRKGNKVRSVPSEIKQEVVSLLSEHKFTYLQRKLGLSGPTLKSWQREYSSSEQIFIELPTVNEKEITNMPLKFSRSNEGTWSIEGALSLKDWQSAIRLLEGVR